ncbi:oxygenase MpaB family protein [Nocardia sp. NPDC005825]|uniref:oxygenase MpaB family protein n=1 Tax=unclassified Nocardia TaxID=2637762 RepID=UPI003400A77B
MNYTSPRGKGELISGRALTRRLAGLDPVRENEEATRLSIEVRYGDALFVHAAYTVAFARQVAIPSISRVVYRRGTGDMMHDVRRRNDDTLVFFGEMLRHGHSSVSGRAAIDRMEAIHSRFGISDQDKLYTLASLAFEADRILEHLGLSVFNDADRLARFHFWRGVGERMGLEVPATRTELLAWTLDYENAHYAYTEGGRALVDQLFDDWRQRWFPGPLRRLADSALLLVLDDQLRATHRLPDPPAAAQRIAPPIINSYMKVQSARPHRLDRSWVDHFRRDDAGPVDLEQIGYRPGRYGVGRTD